MTSTVVQAQFGQREPAIDMQILAAQRGDMHAYRNLYNTYHKKVYSLAYRLTADHGMAEDATQEVFIQLWHKLKTFKGKVSFQHGCMRWLQTSRSVICASKNRGCNACLVRKIPISLSRV